LYIRDSCLTLPPECDDHLDLALDVVLERPLDEAKEFTFVNFGLVCRIFPSGPWGVTKRWRRSARASSFESLTACRG